MSRVPRRKSSGEGAGRRTGVGASAGSPRVSPRHRCPDGCHRRLLPVRGRPLPDRPDGERVSGALLAEPCMFKAPRLLIHGSHFWHLALEGLPRGFSPATASVCVDLLSFCLASSVALKREALLTSKLVPPVSFALQV